MQHFLSSLQFNQKIQKYINSVFDIFFFDPLFFYIKVNYLKQIHDAYSQNVLTKILLKKISNCKKKNVFLDSRILEMSRHMFFDKY